MVRFAALLLSLFTTSVSAFDRDVSSSSLTQRNNRNLRSSDAVEFYASFHNKGVAYVQSTGVSSVSETVDMVVEFLQQDKTFAGRDMTEEARKVKEVFVMMDDGSVDVEGTMVAALKKGADKSPVTAAMLRAVEMVQAEELDSVDDMVAMVLAAGERSGDKAEMEAAKGFAVLAKESEEYWSAQAGEKGHRLLCRWWKVILIVLADAIGFALGLLAAPFPLNLIYAVVFSIAMSSVTAKNLGC